MIGANQVAPYVSAHPEPVAGHAAFLAKQLVERVPDIVVLSSALG